jgi:hypothetical protein
MQACFAPRPQRFFVMASDMTLANLTRIDWQRYWRATFALDGKPFLHFLHAANACASGAVSSISDSTSTARVSNCVRDCWCWPSFVVMFSPHDLSYVILWGVLVLVCAWRQR